MMHGIYLVCHEQRLKIHPPSMNMSIKSGQRYKITNEQTKLALDLHGINHKTIMGYHLHGGENQQWVIDEQVNGQWTIRSVDQQKYLGVEKAPDNGTHLVGLDQPQFWDIEILPGCEDATKPSVKLCQSVRGTCFVVDHPLEKPPVGADLQLWTAWGGKNQIWVLEEYSSWFSHRSVSVKSGQRYKITNEETKLVVDLHAGNRKSILGCHFHGGENQQVTTLAAWITCASCNHDTPVDHGEAGERPMDHSISRVQEVPRCRENSRQWNTSRRPRRASVLGYRDSPGL
ncbi:hypothetical protein EDB92DRAFT_1852700 [Lactarius akahatsu]|uniref:Ricin B lectin domain-containing protein n=1 Tax=Lactarius akahatsu TaxID=416441 RepID=A0AAD4LIS2_9AGAM|nr:hypothetical protein EDB92DRAFT_1852700 [Lactarius akahatsu]